MSLSKRQQARNERALQDLIKTVPGNEVCADCQARNPGWASWSLGIFICMRCAAIHRKMGTHISKVKSLSMDSWTNDQVAAMKRMGNRESNHVYNPNNTKLPIPVDVDEADAAMERFIRQKYQPRTQSTSTQNNRRFSGSSSDEGPPPPLPPKPTSRFGFRSASSIFPLGAKGRNNSANQADHNVQVQERSSSKQSKLLGAHVGPDDTDRKAAKLLEMGFTDEAKNLSVLKSCGGNMEKTIEALAKYMDGSVTSRFKTAQPSQSRTASPAGISIERELPRAPPSQSPTSSNPFDLLDSPLPPPQPQSSQSTGTNPYALHNTNPFNSNMAQSPHSLDTAIQSLTLNPSQRLFPNHTGGFPAQQTAQSPLPQSMTPPFSYPHTNHAQGQFSPNGQMNGYNPFLQSQQFMNPQANAASPHTITNPFAMQQSGTQFNSGYILGQSNSVMHSPEAVQTNPFMTSSSVLPAHMSMQQDPSQFVAPQFQQYRQQTFPLTAQPAFRHDKRSILDLYNYPTVAPQPTGLGQGNTGATMTPQPLSQPLRSFSSPLATHMEVNRNPFLANQSTVMQPTPEMQATSIQAMQPNGRQISRESMAIDAGGWQNGRHSPDAWGRIAGTMQ